LADEVSAGGRCAAPVIGCWSRSDRDRTGRRRPGSRRCGDRRSGVEAGASSAEAMIGLPSETRVWLASGPTDMRRGFDGLALLVQEKLKHDPHCGHLFVFRGKRGGLVKILWHDGQGLCLLAKRLDRGKFIWPRTEGEAVTITPAQLGYLLEGIEI